jgi:hypothetical protein
MIVFGQTDSNAAIRTWNLRNIQSMKSPLRRDAVDEITHSGDPHYIAPLMELLIGDPLVFYQGSIYGCV